MAASPKPIFVSGIYYSQAPLRFRIFIAKISVAPTSPELQALVQAPLNVNGIPNGLREAVLDFFEKMAAPGKFERQLLHQRA